LIYVPFYTNYYVTVLITYGGRERLSLPRPSIAYSERSEQSDTTISPYCIIATYTACKSLLANQPANHRIRRLITTQRQQSTINTRISSKLLDTIKATLRINTAHLRILLRISKSSRATTNRSSDFTAPWSDLTYVCANFGSCRGIAAGTSKSTNCRASESGTFFLF
jgi:hypothetical protein